MAAVGWEEERRRPSRNLMTCKLSASTGESPPPSISAGRCHLPRENCILAFPPYLIPSDLLGQLSNQPCMNRRSTGDKNLNSGPHLQSSQSLQQPVNLSQNFFLPPSTLPLSRALSAREFNRIFSLNSPASKSYQGPSILSIDPLGLLIFPQVPLSSQVPSTSYLSSMPLAAQLHQRSWQSFSRLPNPEY